MLQLTTQLTEQSFVHVPVSVVGLGQAVPPFADGVVIVKVLVLLPFADELLFIHVALHELQSSHLPTQLTGHLLSYGKFIFPVSIISNVALLLSLST